MSKILQPYTHDCFHCIWVGWLLCGNAKNGWGNVYFCPPFKGERGGSIIIRYGDEGSQYISLPVGTCRKESLEVRT